MFFLCCLPDRGWESLYIRDFVPGYVRSAQYCHSDKYIYTIPLNPGSKVFAKVMKSFVIYRSELWFYVFFVMVLFFKIFL